MTGVRPRTLSWRGPDVGFRLSSDSELCNHRKALPGKAAKHSLPLHQGSHTGPTSAFPFTTGTRLGVTCWATELPMKLLLRSACVTSTSRVSEGRFHFNKLIKKKKKMLKRNSSTLQTN